MPTLYLHAGLMITALLSALTGASIAIIFRRRRWWLLYHRLLEIGAVLMIVGGFAAAIGMIVLSGEEHFATLHARFGLTTALMAIATICLGFLQLSRRIKKTARPAFRELHRWSGRVTLALLAVSALSGLRLAGIV
ncbi:MAG: hypothetical protein JW950_11665 [Deltaproteobacteria bacterium]|nr:hypothetical protein [Deltaproteobacteria bacterium]